MESVPEAVCTPSVCFAHPDASALRTTLSSHPLASSDGEEKQKRRFTDKATRKPSKLHDFTKSLMENAQAAIAHNDPMDELCLRQNNNVRIGADTLQDVPLRTDFATYLTPPRASKAPKSGAWPAKSMVSRIRFTVLMGLNECRKELQVVLNKSPELCVLSSFTIDGAVIDVVDAETGTCLGSAHVHVHHEEADEADESSPWNSPTVPSVVLFEFLVGSSRQLELNLLSLCAKVRRSLGAFTDGQVIKNRLLVVPTRPVILEPVYDVLTHTEQTPSTATMLSLPGSCVSLASSDEMLPHNQTSGTAKTVTALFLSSRKPDKILKLLDRNITEAGYLVRKRPGFGLEVEMHGKMTASKTVVITAKREKGLGANTSVVVEGRVLLNTAEHTGFKILESIVGAGLSRRPKRTTM